jgi:HSP20 family protein
MLMRTDPFRELDRLTQQFLGSPGTPGTWSRPTGVATEAIELDVERNVLTVKAERRPPDVGGDNVEMQVAERPLGVFSRQLFLGDTLDADGIKADYEAGVLTLRIPIAEKAKPRKIAIGTADQHKQINA